MRRSEAHSHSRHGGVRKIEVDHENHLARRGSGNKTGPREVQNVRRRGFAHARKMRLDRSMLSIATVNVNGVRAAYRRGMQAWIDDYDPDVVLMQEVRADDDIVHGLVGEDWHVVHSAAPQKGRAGVAILTREEVDAVRIGLPGEAEESGGRWAEIDLTTAAGSELTIASVYVHTGVADDEDHMALKYAYLDAMEKRMADLLTSGRHVVVGGDINVAHDERDIKNWKGNLKSAGFLPQERAYLTRWFSDGGWTDLARHHAGDVPGPYTWWSYRGKAFDNDAGWRIDYLLAGDQTVATMKEITVDRAPTYDTRFSDHAPLRAVFDL